ncbi:hypothetical protein A6R68_07919, partial [Neotoma lepida]
DIHRVGGSHIAEVGALAEKRAGNLGDELAVRGCTGWIMVNLLNLNVAPLHVFQMLKSMCAGQPLATLYDGAAWRIPEGIRYGNERPVGGAVESPGSLGPVLTFSTLQDWWPLVVVLDSGHEQGWRPQQCRSCRFGGRRCWEPRRWSSVKLHRLLVPPSTAMLKSTCAEKRLQSDSQDSVSIFLSTSGTGG